MGIKYATYSENGWKADVEIISCIPQNTRTKYILKVIRTLEAPEDGIYLPDGEEFVAVDYRGVWMPDTWTLTKMRGEL